ncbi:MAG: SH3 domain-containing protein [Chloroflexi bacterium]|nr:MAG: SH3 domain-containing protein [Chloroflexota bacterium]
MKSIWWITILALLSGCSLTSSTAPQQTIQGAPQVTITLPNAPYREGVTAHIQAMVTNAGEDISRVEIAVDGTVIATLPNPNPSGDLAFGVSYPWQTVGLGQHIIQVTAYRADNTSGQATHTLNVVEAQIIQQPIQPSTPTPQPTIPPRDTLPPAPTSNAAPTTFPTSDAAAVPMALFDRQQNVRRGPGTEFVPILGTFAPGDQAEILSLNLTGDWFKVRFGDGEGWVYAPYVTVQGSTSNLPREVGPPTPIPQPTAIPTAVPPPAATNTPQPSLNLVLVDPFIDPPQPNCGQPFQVGMTIRNDSNQRISTGLSRIQDVHIASGTVTASSGDGLIPVDLDPGGTHRVAVTFTIDVYVNETHRIEFIVDVNNNITETNENDNRIGVEYTLPANCP